MENNKLTIRDLTDAEGLYENFIATKNMLIAFILVEALNLDLEDDFMVKNILDNYSVYLFTIKSRDEDIMNISMTSKNGTEQYELYWKYKFLDVDKRTDINEEAKENIRQLIASKIINIEEHTQNSNSIKKEHFMVLGQKLEDKSYEGYSKTAENLSEKCAQVIMEMKEWLNNLNRNLEIRCTDNQETLKILHHFTDNKAALLN